MNERTRACVFVCVCACMRACVYICAYRSTRSLIVWMNLRVLTFACSLFVGILRQNF